MDTTERHIYRSDAEGRENDQEKEGKKGASTGKLLIKKGRLNLIRQMPYE